MEEQEFGEDAIRVELEIIQGQLRTAGLRIPISEMSKWSVSDRAEIEQWVVRKNKVPEIIDNFIKK